MNAPRTQARPAGGPASRRGVFGLGLAALAAGLLGGCEDRSPPLARLIEARRLTAEIRLEFNRATDAANRAVMADTDEVSIASAGEAERARGAVRAGAGALGPLLRGLGYAEESQALGEFNEHFSAYEALDRGVLALAVENSNLKAQRLSFGPARQAADALREALEAVARAAPPKAACQVASRVASATLAVREIQVLQAPHIAEPGDAAMDRMEKEMADLEASARASLVALEGLTEPAARPHLAAAAAALDRFKEAHTRIVALSRKNTNVRALAMSLGPKRPLTSACEASLASLSGALEKRGFTATR